MLFYILIYLQKVSCHPQDDSISSDTYSIKNEKVNTTINMNKNIQQAPIIKSKNQVKDYAYGSTSSSAGSTTSSTTGIK